MLEAESQTDEAESGCGLETNTNRSTSAWRIQPLAHLLLPLPAVCLPNPSSKYYENTFRDKGLFATNSQSCFAITVGQSIPERHGLGTCIIEGGGCLQQCKGEILATTLTCAGGSSGNAIPIA